MRSFLVLSLLFLPASPAAAQEAGPEKCFVKDGRTEGVFYGMSYIADLWGNFRREVWTLRSDGTLLFGAPEGSFEDYVKRDPTAKEKTSSGRYSIDGEKFLLTYPSGSKGEGKVESNSDGSLKRILVGGLQAFPVFRGPGSALSGYWSNTFSFNNAAYKMSTTAYSNFSFFGNGLFVHESGAGTISSAIRERTRETSAGIETVREEVSRFYGGDSPSKMGSFEVKGSGLLLTYDNGTKESRFIGRIGEIVAGKSSLVLIGNGLYEGTFGVFPKTAAKAGAAGAPATAPAAGLGRCTSAQFDLAIPAGWHARQEKLEGVQAFLITPAGVPADDPEGKFTLVLTGTVLDDKTTKATDPAMIASLQSLVTAWVKNEKIEKEGEPETFKMSGVEATRLRFSLGREGVLVKFEASCAVRDGNALVALTIASDEAMKRHGAAARELLAKTVLTSAPPQPRVELQHVKGDGFELDLPKAWNPKEIEQNGVKSLMIVPPSGESEYVIQVIPSEAGAHDSAAAPAAIQELRDLVKQLAPAMEPVGAVDTLKAAGQPAAGVVYGGRNDKEEVILVKAYLVIKAKQAVTVLVVGKESRDKEYGALVRKALESLSLR